jgi:TPR repeat protein
MKAHRQFVLHSILLTISPQLSHAGRFSEKKRYCVCGFDKDRLNTPKEILLNRATKGDAAAQFGMGLKYAHGDGCQQNPTEAVKWFRKGARQGDGNAHFYLGVAYELGDGVDKDVLKAIAHYEKAREEAHGGAASNLGVIYVTGTGVDKNLAAGIGYFDEACNLLDSPEGMNNWGAYIQELQGDDVQAEGFFRESAFSGNDAAQYNLGVMYTKGVTRTRTRGEGVKWLEKAAKQGNTDAMCYLGLMYAYGKRGLRKNYAKSYAYFSMAKERGNSEPALDFLAKLETWMGREELALACRLIEEKNESFARKATSPIKF